MQYAPGHFELFDAVFFHLQLHEFTGETHLSYIIATYTFYRQPITLFQDGVHIITVKVFTATFAERHFYDRVRFSAVMQRKCIEPVKNVQPVAPTGAAPTITFTARRLATGTRRAIATSHLNMFI